MQKRNLTAIGLAVVLLAMSCKQHEHANTKEAETLAVTDSVAEHNPLTTNATVEPQSRDKKFVRTGAVRVRVKDVVQSTHRIENTVSAVGGFVVHTQLESFTDQREETAISTDSLMVTTQYHTENDMVLRVPTSELNTVLQAISKEIEFVDYRKIDAEDVTTQLRANQLEQQRKKQSAQRIAAGIDQRAAKLNQVVEAEKVREATVEAKDTKLLQNEQLNDKISYATLELKLYQNSAIKQERLASMDIQERSRPKLGYRLWTNAKTGWYAFENLLSGLVLLWPLGVIGGAGYYGYRKWARK